MDLHAGIQRAQGCSPQVMGSRGGGPNQDDLVGKCSSSDSTAEDIADGKMRKAVWWAQIVNEQLTSFASRDKALAHLYPFHPVAPNLHRELRLAQVVPGTQDC